MPHIKDNILFVHIPKCGGNSIKEAIGGREFSYFDHGKITPQQSKKEYFKFTFVRNPWDRFVSAYNYLKNVTVYDKYHREILNTYYPTFKDFVISMKRQTSLPSWLEWLHFLPQHEFISVDGNVCMDFVGRVENMQSDFNKICKEVGLEAKTLNHVNTSKHKHYTEYFDDETRQIIADVYARDIELFKYEYGTPI